MVPKKETAGEKALRLLSAHLAAGSYGNGDRLSPERLLAGELDVSRRALRGALMVLEAEGRIWRGVGQGTFVGRPPAVAITNLVEIGRQIGPTELMEARLTLEPSIAARATAHATTADIAEARRCLQKSAGVNDPLSWELWDGAFHKAIADSTHNKLIGVLFEALNSVRKHAEWAELRRNSLNPGRKKTYTEQHMAILAAICDRKPADAADAMRTHLLTVRETLLVGQDEIE